MLNLRVLLGGLWMLAGWSEARAQYPAGFDRDFVELAATEDGKWVYFTSYMVLKGHQQGNFLETRLYRYGPDGVTLFAERGKLAPKNGFASSDGVERPQVNYDGSLVGFTLRNICLDNRSKCLQEVQAEAEIQGNQNLDLGPGTLQISRNGRWALVIDTVFSADSPFLGTVTSILVDLQSGARISTPPPPCDVSSWWQPCRTLASDGSVLVQQGDVPGIWKQGVFKPLSSGASVLSDDGGTMFAQGTNLVALGVNSGTQTIVAHSPYTLMDVSSDGRYVLYGSFSLPQSGPVYFVETASGQAVNIPMMPGESGTSGALAGGEIAFVATTTGRIVKFTKSTGTVETLFPATQCVLSNSLAPGTLAELQCPVRTTRADPKVKIEFFGVEAPVLSVSETGVWFQVPWDTHANGLLLPSLMKVHLPGDAPFRADQWVFINSFAPEFQKADPGETSLLGLKLIKADWSGLLTEQPGPGDIVNAYMTGLGTVSGPMVNGVAAPVGVVAPIAANLKCWFVPQSSDAETLFAGLAPGLIGVYQATFRMPADAGLAPITSASCAVPGSGLGGVVGGFPNGSGSR